jgi:hypothetical protein
LRRTSRRRAEAGDSSTRRCRGGCRTRRRAAARADSALLRRAAACVGSVEKEGDREQARGREGGRSTVAGLGPPLLRGSRWHSGEEGEAEEHRRREKEEGRG